MISLKNITKEFDNGLVLDDISLDIREGEVVAIMGSSGSGKSTLLKIVSDLIPADKGEISFADKSFFTKSLVSQKPALFPWRTIKNNVAYGLELQGINHKESAQSVENVLKMTQLIDYAEALPIELSGGMQQRAALASAIITEPDLLIMDEPLSALDTQTKSQMRDLIRNLLVEKKQTTLIVTHDPEEALFLADRIIILSPKPGKIIDEIVVSFEKERNRAILYEEAFQELKKYISYIMYAELIRTRTDIALEPDKHLSIGSNIWAGTLPLYFAQEQKLFEKEGLESYNLITLEWSSHNRMMPLNEGLVDVLNMTLETAIIASETNPDLRILMPIDVSTGGDALVTTSDVKDFSGLKGKRIAVEEGWISEFYLHYLLDKNNISMDEVEIVYTPSKDAPKALLSQRVDAIVTQEPWLSEISGFKNFNILATTKEDDLIYAVLVVNEKNLNKKASLIRSFVSAMQLSINSIISNSDNASKKTAHVLGVSDNHLRDQLKSLRFISVDEYEEVKNSVDVIEEILLKSEMLKKPFDRSKLLF